MLLVFRWYIRMCMCKQAKYTKKWCPASGLRELRGIEELRTDFGASSRFRVETCTSFLVRTVQHFILRTFSVLSGRWWCAIPFGSFFGTFEQRSTCHRPIRCLSLSLSVGIFHMRCQCTPNVGSTFDFFPWCCAHWLSRAAKFAVKDITHILL